MCVCLQLSKFVEYTLQVMKLPSLPGISLRHDDTTSLHHDDNATAGEEPVGELTAMECEPTAVSADSTSNVLEGTAVCVC